MIKQRLLASAAVAALLAFPAAADTTLDSDTTTALTTGDLLSGDVGTADAGNITLETGYALTITEEKQGAITIDSSNYVYVNGDLKNKDTDYAYGLHIDMSTDPVLTGVSFTNYAGSTIVGSGIYLDSKSTLNLSGDGDYKKAIYFDSTLGDGTYTGDVTIYGSTITVEGTSSYGLYLDGGSTLVGDITFDSTASITMTDGTSSAIYFASGAEMTGDMTFGSSTSIYMTGNSNYAINMATGSLLTGDLTLGGSITLVQKTVRSTSSSSLYGVLMNGEIDGDVVLGSASSITVIGAGGTGMSIQGTGIDGSLSIGGSIATVGYSASYDSSSSSYYSSSTLSTYPEGGTALSIGASITNGIEIEGAAYSGQSTATGSVSTGGTSAAVSISPGSNTVSQTDDLVIGVYEYNGAYDSYNPGFSFYNRGSISASPLNYNSSATTVYMLGNSVYHTVLTGGFYNSGTITASATTDDDSDSVATANAIYIGAYTYLDNATFDETTGTWSDTTLAAKNSEDQAAFVNSNASGSGTISAVVSGLGAGHAVAINIAQYASVPSLINSGTILASATTTDKEITQTISSSSSYTLLATAIYDASGTLTSIYNTGTIRAVAGVTSSSSTTVTQLDSDAQLAVAIDLSSGNTATASGSGVTITERATATNAATIVGDIYFGTGDNQVIDVEGTSTTYTASIYGNIVYGATGSNAIADTLRIGAYGIVSGKVTAGSGPGVAVSVESNGTLILKNDTTALNAASVYVADSGNLSIAVSQSLTSDGSIASKGSVVLASGSNLYLTYASFVPQGSNDFVLITAPEGEMQINSGTLANANTDLATAVSDGGTLPYLFSSADLEVTSNSAGDTLVLHVVPKTATELGLAGYAKQLFPYVNDALSVDNDLGAAMIYGIHNQSEAQSAYSAFAPNVTGGDRAIAISLTDSATGPVAARQRSLLMMARQEGGTSVWANEFIQMIKDPGTGGTVADGTRELSGFKDHGFGITVGIDSGAPKAGWYGLALSYYAGDVGEIKRTSKTNEQWLILSGYSVWRGKGLFLNSKVDVGYGKFDGTRTISLTTAYSTSGTTSAVYARKADNSRTGLLLSGGLSTGSYMNFGSTTLTPTLSLDGMMMRQEGYTEHNPSTATDGDAFNLKVQPYYARSLRAFLGFDARYDVQMGDFFLQPELRAGYRYDFFSDPVKLKVAFAHADTSPCGSGVTVTTSCGTAGEQFTITGPDPSKGNLVLGGSLGATTGAWTMGLHFDYVRGANGAIQEVGTLSVVGRI